jgi:hypothetical protein
MLVSAPGGGAGEVECLNNRYLLGRETRIWIYAMILTRHGRMQCEIKKKLFPL